MYGNKKIWLGVLAASWLAATYVGAPAIAGAASGGAPSCGDGARWGLVIDAGSSGSRLRFYCWRPGDGDGLPWVEEVGSKKQEPGIADAECRHTPEEATAGLEPLIDYARETVGERAAGTPLIMMATGGLRRCPASYSQAMLSGIRQYLAGTPFADPRAELISGAEEGRFGWTGVNYLLGRLDPELPPQTVGALDLGGASTQITFMSRPCAGTEGECGELELGDRSYPLYTHSYLGWGQDEAMRRVASGACYLRGYRSGDGTIVGRGRYAACRRAIRKGMTRVIRADPPAPACRNSCNRLGAYQPPLPGDFVAFSAFAYNTEFLGLDAGITLEQVRAAGKDYCRTSWRQATAECDANPRPDCRWLNRYCFASAYIVTLLHDVYGLPMDREITSTNQLAGADIDWTLGVMVQMAEELTD